MKPVRTRFQAIAIAVFCLVMALLPLTGCGGGSSASKPPPFDASRVTSLVTAYAGRHAVTGISAAVVNRGKLVWTQGFGKANKALGTPATEDSVFLIASISKTVTAVAVMQLVEQGKLGLDTDINRYLPFHIVNPHHADKLITLRELLSHTSSLVDDYYYSNAGFPALYTYQGDPSLSLADFCRAFFVPGGQYYDATTFSDAAPGTHFSYCNIGVALAGYIVESVAKQSFADYCKQKIFQPLGMTRTSWRVSDFQTQDMAMPYDGDGHPIGNYTFADYPDGALRTTVKDLSRFLRAFIQNGTLEGVTMLRPESVREMRRTQFPDLPDAAEQGLAWRGETINGLALFGHSGAEQGVTTGMYYDPKTGVGAIFFQNRLVEDDAEIADLQTLFSQLITIGEGQ